MDTLSTAARRRNVVEDPAVEARMKKFGDLLDKCEKNPAEFKGT